MSQSTFTITVSNTEEDFTKVLITSPQIVGNVVYKLIYNGDTPVVGTLTEMSQTLRAAIEAAMDMA